jgi:hypothetical protein
MRININLKAILALGLIFAFLVNMFGPLCPITLAQARLPSSPSGEFYLPAPGVMVHLSPEFDPPILKGIKIHPDNPFQFDFILDQGRSLLTRRVLIPDTHSSSRESKNKENNTCLFLIRSLIQ